MWQEEKGQRIHLGSDNYAVGFYKESSTASSRGSVRCAQRLPSRFPGEALDETALPCLVDIAVVHSTRPISLWRVPKGAQGVSARKDGKL